MTHKLLAGFPAVFGANPNTLILGSMPSVASLQAAQYYAHPRNAFWPIVAELLAFSAELSYPEKLAELTARGYALWDVVRYCQRPGSLDSAIDPASVKTNDFAKLLLQFPDIHRVFLNGSAAYKLWNQRVVNTLPRPVAAVQLPSTSPAYAAMPVDEKRRLWRQILI